MDRAYRGSLEGWDSLRLLTLWLQLGSSNEDKDRYVRVHQHILTISPCFCILTSDFMIREVSSTHLRMQVHRRRPSRCIKDGVGRRAISKNYAANHNTRRLVLLRQFRGLYLGMVRPLSSDSHVRVVEGKPACSHITIQEALTQSKRPASYPTIYLIILSNLDPPARLQR